MSPPSWLYWPTAAAGVVPKVSFSGTMAFSTALRNSLTSFTQSGTDSADFSGQTTQSVRTNASDAFIEYFFDVTGTPWATGDDFVNGVSNLVYKLTANGVEFPHTSVTYNNTGTEVRARLSADTPAENSAFWTTNMNDEVGAVPGDGSFEFTISYD